jgi:hypothetical protein
MTAKNDTTGDLIYARALSDEGRNRLGRILEADQKAKERSKALLEANEDKARERAQETAREITQATEAP